MGSPIARQMPRLGDTSAYRSGPAPEFFLHGDLESGLVEGRTDEASTVHGRSDHRGFLRSTRPGRRRRIWRASTASRKLYNWKAKYGGMDVCEAKRLKQLEDENAKLKKLLAEQMLDAAALRELLSKKWGPAEGVAHLRATMGLSERRACWNCQESYVQGPGIATFLACPGAGIRKSAPTSPRRGRDRNVSTPRSHRRREE
jgi:Transposase